MRIVSLLPAATEWVCAFGGLEDLVGRSHACDSPASVRELPAVTVARESPPGDSAAIDASVRDRVTRGLSIYDVDVDRLRGLRPDLLLTQAQCGVCAVSLDDIDDVLAQWTHGRPDVLALEPSTLREVLETGLRVGRMMGRADASMRWMAKAERRLEIVRRSLGLERHPDHEALPTVACIEWMEPLMTGGHWMPDVAEKAGAQAILSERGEASRYVDWEALRTADPDAIAVMPCGFTLEETVPDLNYLTDRPGWSDLRAVKDGRVVLFDGNAYFNRPGPRLYRSIELLAAALHPGQVPPSSIDAQPWELRRLEGVAG